MVGKRPLVTLVVAVLAACPPAEEREIPPVDDDPVTRDENRYHWDGQADPFFEGWYYKVDDLDSGASFFFIYGVIFPADPERGEAFLHFGGGPDRQWWYVPFPIETFHASRSRCEVYLESVDTMATEDRISGSVEADGESIRWEIDLNPRRSWDETMGLFTNVDGLDVNWHVSMLTGEASGFIEIGDRRYELSQALAYSDHNWGPAFPEYWMWLQGADFEQAETAISISGGQVTALGTTMEAFQIGYLRDGALHLFRTQDMADISGRYAEGEWTLEAVRSDERLTIRAMVDEATFMELLMPSDEGMIPGALESLEGTIEVTLWELDGERWTEVDTRTTERAGVEIGGTWPL